jgi:hypothetical protein
MGRGERSMNNINFLFRGKRGDNGELIYGDLCGTSSLDPFTYIVKGAGYHITDSELGKKVKIRPDSLSFYIGKEDMFGNKIFTTDKVLVSEHYDINGERKEKPKIYTVKYSSKSCFFYLQAKDGTSCTFDYIEGYRVLLSVLPVGVEEDDL